MVCADTTSDLYLPASRKQIALEYLKAFETDDKAALERVLSDTFERVTLPCQRFDFKSESKQLAVERASWRTQYQEVKVIPVEVLETVDGKIVTHSHWQCLKHGGQWQNPDQWVHSEEMHIFSFVNGQGPDEDPKIVHIKVFLDWVGAVQMAWPNPEAWSVQSLYRWIMGYM